MARIHNANCAVGSPFITQDGWQTFIAPLATAGLYTNRNKKPVKPFGEAIAKIFDSMQLY